MDVGRTVDGLGDDDVGSGIDGIFSDGIIVVSKKDEGIIEPPGVGVAKAVGFVAKTELGVSSVKKKEDSSVVPTFSVGTIGASGDNEVGM